MVANVVSGHIRTSNEKKIFILAPEIYTKYKMHFAFIPSNYDDQSSFASTYKIYMLYSSDSNGGLQYVPLPTNLHEIYLNMHFRSTHASNVKR